MSKNNAAKKEGENTRQAVLAAKPWWQEPAILIRVGLAMVAAAVAMWPVLDAGFTNWDDDVYVYNNLYIQNLSVENIKRYISGQMADNYHPLTMLSLALDHLFGGLEPAAYHRTNLILHILNVLMVFQFIYILSKGKRDVALFVAVLFGVHPMHVESVAWVAERKDLLYTLFFIPSLTAWLKYRDSNAKAWYVFSIGLFLLACLSKPAAVVLPLILVILDYAWAKDWLSPRSWLEKLPFFMLAFIFGMITYRIQQAIVTASGQMVDLSLPQKLVLACYSLIAYGLKMVVPMKLSAFYPYPGVSNGLPGIYYLGLAGVLGLGAGLYILNQRSRDAVFGVLFFMITLLLVLQVISIGSVMMSERYTYVPYIGLLYSMGIGFYFLKEKQKMLRNMLTGLLGLVALGFTVISYGRCQVWESSETLWNDAIQKAPKAALPHNNLGQYFYEKNQFGKALTEYERAIQLDPHYPNPYHNRGLIYFVNKDIKKALADFNKAIELRPDYGKAYEKRGNIYYHLGQYEQALSDYERALADNNQNFYVYGNRANIYFLQKQYEKALIDYTTALTINPNYGHAFLNRSKLHNQLGNKAKALSDGQRAQQLGEDVPQEYLNNLQ